ncbi:energy-coupling factor transporter ATPase [Salsuginibacillus kocurii]|uniref:energy-coupling factor transporter ATPase n=1 Tax=Salsuginibacillus kocurii TaxID=427078 RepID=UPI00037AB817|nr:energy-coupling factor transporter ATPase [Salsuginibacillus kocurii]
MLTFTNVSFTYPGGRHVLNDLTFHVQKGEFISIVGPNGCGKSTAARLMNGLLLPTSGSIHVDGFQLTTASLQDVRQMVGMVFQNPEDQLITTTVFDELIFGLENIACPREEMDERAERALRQVGMEHFKDRQPHQLSGGQKQRVAIAAVLAMRPNVLIFDEVTSMLDPAGKQQVMELMKALHEDGFTVINITHCMEEVLFSSRVLLLDQGVVQVDEPSKELLQQPGTLREHQLEAPFVVRANESLRQAGLPLPVGITTYEGLVEALCNLN